jgi:hypothetical protein
MEGAVAIGDIRFSKGFFFLRCGGEGLPSQLPNDAILYPPQFRSILIRRDVDWF